MSNGELKIMGRHRRVVCKMCLESRIVDVETWDDRVEAKFDHDCKVKGPKLSWPVTRDGAPLPMFPVGKRLAVQRIPQQEDFGGIVIPETSQAPQQYATVCAAGPQAQGMLEDMGIKIGDTICFAKYSGVGWDWVTPGDGLVSERQRRVDLINVDDIQGGKELAEKMIDGRMAISLYRPEGGGDGEYRFFEEVKKEETSGKAE